LTCFIIGIYIYIYIERERERGGGISLLDIRPTVLLSLNVVVVVRSVKGHSSPGMMGLLEPK